MINNRLISANTVLAKAISDFNLKEDQIKISDFREWICEGLLKIGAIQQYKHKVEVIPVVGHQAKLPCDLYKLGQVAYSTNCNGGWVSMRKSTSSFGVTHDKCAPGACMIIQDTALFPLVKQIFRLNTDNEALEKLNSDKDLRSTLSSLINLHTVPSGYKNQSRYTGHVDDTMYSFDLQYTTKPGYINTNVPTGFLKIEYYAIYTDEDGMPMIPDLESYKEALLWYIGVKHFYPKYLNGKMNREIYYDIKRSWNFYRKLAYGEAMTPGVDELESIKNDWHKLYPDMNEHDTFFSTIGEQQHIYNLNYV